MAAPKIEQRPTGVRCRILATAVLALLVGSPESAEIALATAPDGTPHVANSAVPENGLHDLHLQELWRVGGADDGVLFGRVIRAAVDGADNVYLLDAQLCQVEVFDPAGRHLRTLGREGDGPGEIRQPADMVFLGDGTFGILSRFPGRMIRLHPDGTPAGSSTISARGTMDGGFTAAHFAAVAGGDFIIVGNEVRGERGARKRTWFVGRYDLQGRELVRYHAFDYFPDGARPTLVERNILSPLLDGCAVGPAGRVYVAPSRDEYLIRVHDADGSLQRIIARDYDACDRSPIQATRAREILEMWASRRPGGADLVVEESTAAVSGLRAAGNGELWVDSGCSTRNRPAGVFKTYDVFDHEGRFAKQVAVHCEGDPLDDQLFFLRDDLAVLIKGYHPTFYALMGRVAEDESEEDADNMEIVVYRVVD